MTSLYLANIAINIPRSMTDYQLIQELILKTTTTILTTSEFDHVIDLNANNQTLFVFDFSAD